MGAFIAGFVLSSLTQGTPQVFYTLGLYKIFFIVQALDAEHIGDFWKYVFWLSCDISIGASVYVMLVTTFINVYGPGLALRGKAG